MSSVRGSRDLEQSSGASTSVLADLRIGRWEITSDVYANSRCTPIFTSFLAFHELVVYMYKILYNMSLLKINLDL